MKEHTSPGRGTLFLSPGKGGANTLIQQLKEQLSVTLEELQEKDRKIQQMNAQLKEKDECIQG